MSVNMYTCKCFEVFKNNLKIELFYVFYNSFKFIGRIYTICTRVLVLTTLFSIYSLKVSITAYVL
jgi:hypothetical protein